MSIFESSRWTEWDELVNGMGICRSHLGMLVIPGRPDIVGIRVGTHLDKLLALFEAEPSAETLDFLGYRFEGLVFQTLFEMSGRLRRQSQVPAAAARASRRLESNFSLGLGPWAVLEALGATVTWPRPG